MNPETLLHPLLPTPKCSFNCPILDRFLHGGLPCNSITELVSESGCGKTQLCLQLLLSAQLPLSLAASSSLYIHSEFPFPLRRLRQLSHSFPSLQNPLDSIFIRPVHSADELFDLLLQLDFSLSNPPKTQLPIKLVVIDSIAALFRSEFDNTPSDLKRRSSLFFKISSKLKSLANQFRLAVVVTNQVVDFVGSDDGLNGLRVGNLGCLYSSGRRVCPALGLSWANCVNSRLFLSKDEEVLSEEKSLVDVGDDGYVQRRTRRQIRVVFAPHLPESSSIFIAELEKCVYQDAVWEFGVLYLFGSPVLGLSWANFVKLWLFLLTNKEVLNEEKSLVDVSDDGHVQRRTRRQIHINFAPHLPELPCEFATATDGVFGIER